MRGIRRGFALLAACAIVFALVGLCVFRDGFAEIGLPASLSEIEEEAFLGDASLRGLVVLPDGASRVGAFAFSGSGVYALEIPSSVVSVGENALAGAPVWYLFVHSADTAVDPAALDDALYVFAPTGSAAESAASLAGARSLDCGRLVALDGFYYYLADDQTASLVCAIDATALPEYAFVAEEVNGAKVAKALSNAFFGCERIAGVVLPKGVALEDGALANNPNAAVSYMPDSSKITVVVDGVKRSCDGYLIGNEFFLAPDDIEALFGTESFDQTLICLRSVARVMNAYYEHDGVLSSAYIWTNEPYFDDITGDFPRAISLELVPESVINAPEDALRSAAFRQILANLVRRLAPEKLAWFESNITLYDKPLKRGEGAVMAYYAAIALGEDFGNNAFDHTRDATEDFWSTDDFELDDLFPNWNNGSVYYLDDVQRRNEWADTRIAALLWGMWRSSPVSSAQIFEFDEKSSSMRYHEYMTAAEGAKVVARLYDGFPRKAQSGLVPIASTEAVSPSISPSLLDKANAREPLTDEDVQNWTGFIMSDGGSYNSTNIVASEKDIRMIANWGFTSARYMLTYQTLFSADASSVNVDNLKKLDELVAAAIKYDINLNILTFSLPGRWAATDFSTYESTAELDLFTNPERQAEALRVWQTLAERYKDVPSRNLTFTPIWEARNDNLSTGLPVEPYTTEDVTGVYDMLIAGIRERDPDRFIVYEPTAMSDLESLERDSVPLMETIETKWDNTLVSFNFCESAYVYAEMPTTGEGSHIDFHTHSMFKPEYPTTIYAAQRQIHTGQQITLDGVLPAGTQIALYLARTYGNGDLTIQADGASLYCESYGDSEFAVGPSLSDQYRFAKSERCIRVTLTADTDAVAIRYGGEWFDWSGIEVTLPQEYAVERWYYTSQYDLFLEGDESGYAPPRLEKTSAIQISPRYDCDAREIQIHDDVRYSTGCVVARSNRETIREWARAVSELAPNALIRLECCGFSLGTDQASAIRYYRDLLEALNEYGLNWYSNEYNFCVLNGCYAGGEAAQYGAYSYFNAELVELFRQYQANGG